MNPDFRDMLCALSEANVEYMLVGAYALAAHGFPRATGDLDIWVKADPENASRVMAALTSFGAPLHDISRTDFAQPEIVFQIGVAPIRIDLLTSVSGVSFDSAWQNRMTVILDGISVFVIGRSDLIANKRAAGRAKDLADAETLERNSPDE